MRFDCSVPCSTGVSRVEFESDDFRRRQWDTIRDRSQRARFHPGGGARDQRIRPQNHLPFVHTVNVSETYTENARLLYRTLSSNAESIFLLRNNPLVGQELVIDDVDSVRNSFWNPNNPTHIITHGWQGSAEKDSCTVIRDGRIISLTKLTFLIVTLNNSRLLLFLSKFS